MSEWEKEQKIYDLRNQIIKDVGIGSFGYTDFDRFIVLETENGEELVQVKEIYYEAKPNTCKGVTDRIIKDYTSELGWEFLAVHKEAWVNGYIKHRIYFRF